MYDVTSKDSLEVARDWIQSVRDNVATNCLICLVGNKTDLIESIEVSRRQGELFAEQNNVESFFETSALEGTGVQELFNHIGEQVLNRK